MIIVNASPLAHWPSGWAALWASETPDKNAPTPYYYYFLIKVVVVEAHMPTLSQNTHTLTRARPRARMCAQVCGGHGPIFRKWPIFGPLVGLLFITNGLRLFLLAHCCEQMRRLHRKILISLNIQWPTIRGEWPTREHSLLLSSQISVYELAAGERCGDARPRLTQGNARFRCVIHNISACRLHGNHDR